MIQAFLMRALTVDVTARLANDSTPTLFSIYLATKVEVETK